MKKVLFLCTGNYYRSRFAEILFNALAREAGLDWRADSRGLETRLITRHSGTIAAKTLEGLAARGVNVDKDARYPIECVEEDFSQADLVVALKESEHRPYLEAKFPPWQKRVEYWDIADLGELPAAEALDQIENEVRRLIRRLAATQASLNPYPPMLLLSGPPHRAKTACARQVARRLRLPLFSQQRLVQALSNSGGVQSGSPGEYDLLFHLAGEQLTLGIGVVLDAVFPSRSLRAQASDLAARYQASFFPVYCYCSTPTPDRGQPQADRAQSPAGKPSGAPGKEEPAFEAWDPAEALSIDACGDFDENLARLLEWVQDGDRPTGG